MGASDRARGLAASGALEPGSRTVTETWSVTTKIGNGSSITSTTYTGRETGTLVITNGSYNQIDHTLAPGIDPARTINYYSPVYSIQGDIPLDGLLPEPTATYAVIKLTFFVIEVPVPLNNGISGQQNPPNYYTTAGTSLTSLVGSGSYLDGNAPFTEDGYINEIDASSTSSLSYSGAVNDTISVSASPSAGGSVGGGGTYALGSSQTVTATANNGYTFTDWTVNGTVVSTSADYTFTVNSNETLVANFTQATDPFNGTSQGNGLYDSAWFGYYLPATYPLVYEYNLGYEYVFPTSGGVYFYDYKSSHFWYTQANYFPFIYDFSLGTFLYYYEGNGNPRYFQDYANGQVISE